MPNSRKLQGGVRPSRPRKKKFTYDAEKMENENAFASASAAKMKNANYDNIEVDVGHNNVILDFLSVFNFLSQCLKCKECDGDVKFSRMCVRGLGFELLLTCNCTKQRRVSSSPLVNTAYEINRRFMFVTRILGLGLRSMNVFCSLMELSTGFGESVYYTFIGNLHEAAKSTFEIIQRKAVHEEKMKNVEAGNEETHLSVSGDGSWRKRGFSSLFAIATLIGKYTHKVVDLAVESSFCQGCANWSTAKETPEYDTDSETHEEMCSISHSGSASKMEIDGMIEIFSRSEASLGVKYATYIGDGDAKTFRALLDCDPYGDLTVQKEECTGHVQKRTGTGLHACVWKLAPKHFHCGVKTIELAAYITTGIFNEGYSSILKTMNTLGIIVGTNSRNFAELTDRKRVAVEGNMSDYAKKARMEKTNFQIQQIKFFEEEEGPLYGAGIVD